MNAARVLAAALLAATFSAAAAPRAEAGSEDYFPLGQGDRWTYSNRRFGGQATIEVLSSRSTRDGQVATVRNSWGAGEQRTIFRYRTTVYEYDYSQNRWNRWYRLAGQVGNAWTITVASPETCVNGSRVSIVSRSETVTVPAGTFNDCLVLAFSSHCRDAGVTLEAFAPGVGLVKRVATSIAGPVEQVLVDATVGGVQYPRAPQSGFGVSLTLDGYQYVNNRMPGSGPRPSPVLTATLEVRNGTSSDIVFNYRSSQTYDVIVRDAAGNVHYQWSANKRFLQTLRSETLAAGASLTYTETVDLGTLPDGGYTVEFRLAGWPNASGTASFELSTVW